MGSPGHPGSGKIKKTANFTHFGVPKKNASRKAPQNPKNAKKSKFRKNEAVSSNLFAYDLMANLLRLTGELGNFEFRIDGPEIWPGQNWVGGVGGGVALPPPPTNNLDVNRGWYPKGIPAK